MTNKISCYWSWDKKLRLTWKSSVVPDQVNMQFEFKLVTWICHIKVISVWTYWQLMTIDLTACAILPLWLHLKGMMAYNNNKEWKNSGNYTLIFGSKRGSSSCIRFFMCLFEKYVHNPLRTKFVKTKPNKYKLYLNEDKTF